MAEEECDLRAAAESKKPRADTQVVGNVGLYYVCYKLSLMGWNVMPTARNARGVDIICYDASALRYIGIQVKTLSARNAVPLGSSLDKLMGDFWVVVNRVATAPQAFILTPKEVRARAHGNKTGRESYWLEAKDYEVDEFRDGWARIGTGHPKSELPAIAPTA